MSNSLRGIGLIIALELVALLALAIKWVLTYGWTIRISMEIK